jgi:hypothetical protein
LMAAVVSVGENGCWLITDTDMFSHVECLFSLILNMSVSN